MCVKGPVASVTDDGLKARELFGLTISRQDRDGILADILDPPARGAGPQLLATVNLDHVVNLRKNERFRGAYKWAWRVTIDGAPVFAYARMRGAAPPARITGADLFADLARAWSPGKHKLFFCVSSEEAGTRMRTFLQDRGFEEGDVRFEVPPFGFERSADVTDRLAASIKAFSPTHLIMALGSPKSEVWVFENRQELGDLKVLCIGAAVEFLVGLKRRSPRWMSDLGFEWIWRLGSEPRRLFRRYCIDSVGFLRAIRADLRTNGESVI